MSSPHDDRVIETDAGAEGQPLTTDEVHRLLSNERRRVAVAVLTETGSIHLDDLAAAVVARTATDGTITSQGGPGDVERVEVSLHHHHLPYLDDAGLVDFDVEAGYVTARGGLADVASVRFPA
jgi:predicted ABC-class ATPase